VTNLFRDGYCTPPEDGGESKDGGELTGIEGTGMGEGKGEKDVSDQLEDEDKIMGEKYDEEQKPEDKNEPVCKTFRFFQYSSSFKMMRNGFPYQVVAK